jgi:hypothetical protein
MGEAGARQNEHPIARTPNTTGDQYNVTSTYVEARPPTGRTIERRNRRDRGGGRIERTRRRNGKGEMMSETNEPCSEKSEKKKRSGEARNEEG